MDRKEKDGRHQPHVGVNNITLTLVSFSWKKPSEYALDCMIVASDKQKWANDGTILQKVRAFALKFLFTKIYLRHLHRF